MSGLMRKMSNLVRDSCGLLHGQRSCAHITNGDVQDAPMFNGAPASKIAG